MDLTLKEAATYLGKSPRQLRYLIKTGRIPAKKRAGRYVLSKDALPGSAKQEDAKEKKQEQFKTLTEQVLGPPKTERRHKSFSIRNLKVFEAGRRYYLELSGSRSQGDQALEAVKAALLLLAQGCHAYHKPEKVNFFKQSREKACLAVGLLYLEPEPHPIGTLLESDFVGGLSALIRRAEKGARS